MKKLTAIALLSIALVSCKKETKTVTKVDPKTGKTITVEVPADSTKLVNPETTAAPVLAIKDSAGVFRQTFVLEKGKSYPLITVQKDVQTLTAPNGQSQSGTNETTDEMSFLVNGFENGIYDITINLLRKKNSQSANGKSISTDTKAAEPTEEQFKMMWKVNKALVGNTLNLKMDSKGNVKSITGFDPVYSKVAASVNTLLKDAKEREEFLKSFKASFNEKVLKEQFTKNLVLFPAKGVKVGESWSEHENATPDGKVKLITTYVFKGVQNGDAEIAVSGGIPKKSDKQTQQQMSRTMSSELTQSGKILLDQHTGWIKNQTMHVKTSQVETLSDGKQSQTMKSVSNSTVTVNP
ncbi:DUF6263 family protein [Chryseobacterium koreense]|uniref:Lipoprotein n=1 Tax=Chryseobacterium koreense CCUG 49689 TaxID=1304281 RepID=A0A0J7J0Z0_9FLAO|nr:DUF6263 family protein [Chryseobacterium koreense]KMQ71942.1 hypothetical protein ACM44_04720 [Chryseobacterium koreense CCUG 49689]MBB5334095.1 hypothetical protein [Chryseobacterium koreense]